jgi:adenylate cyclase
MLETERKFLLESAPAWLGRCESIEIEQGYLAIAESAEVRVRRAGEEFTLTAKRGAGETREEYEVPLRADQAMALWDASAGLRLRKRRHLVPLEGGLRAEVDVYEGELAGLVVAEVEFPSPERAGAFAPPSWFGREVTGEARYSNQQLALRGTPSG